MRIICGDALESLRRLPDGSVNCCATSPPYYGLRDYGVAGQLGLEPTPDAYVAALVAVFAEVRRVLRSDGTCWLNLGDSYAAARGGTGMPAETLAGGKNGHGDELSHRGRGERADYSAKRDCTRFGAKHKDLLGIPWLVAFALRADGWYLRQDIIWAKPNPMPESVTDRCTKSHEYIFMLTKSARYWSDMNAISEEYETAEGPPRNLSGEGYNKAFLTTRGAGERTGYERGRRNKRSVWTVTTQPYAEAHFATFPPALIEPCILAGCPAGGIVLDPFAGSGTTLMVAQNLGRESIGIELNPKYIRMIEKRTRQTALAI